MGIEEYLYRYQTLNKTHSFKNLEALLLDNKLSCGSIEKATYNDPSDAKNFSINIVGATYEEKKTCVELSIRDIHDAKDKEEILKGIHNEKFLNSSFDTFPQFINEQFQKISRQYFIASFSLNKPYGKHKMWSEYADSEAGYCLTFSYRQENNDGFYKVAYSKAKIPTVGQFNELAKGNEGIVIPFLAYKHDEWKDEAEYRLIVEYPDRKDEPYTLHPIGGKFKFMGITLGCKLTKKNKNEIDRILKERAKKFPDEIPIKSYRANKG